MGLRVKLSAVYNKELKVEFYLIFLNFDKIFKFFRVIEEKQDAYSCTACEIHHVFHFQLLENGLGVNLPFHGKTEMDNADVSRSLIYFENKEKNTTHRCYFDLFRMMRMETKLKKRVKVENKMMIWMLNKDRDHQPTEQLAQQQRLMMFN